MLQQLMFGEGISIGTFVEGGYFAGYISQTANGVATHGLIVAPAASGYNGQNTIQLKTSTTSTSGTSSVFDGAANTANMANTSHPAANYCAGLGLHRCREVYEAARDCSNIKYSMSYNCNHWCEEVAKRLGANI